MPLPTYPNGTEPGLGGAVAANPSQSNCPPGPFVSVTVTLEPGAAVVVLTVSTGGGAIVNGSAADVPPPGAGVKTVTCAVAGAATSAAPIDARSCVLLTNVVAR